MKLELKHISPYLPYKLRLVARNVVSETPRRIFGELTNTNIMSLVENDTLYKPILRPCEDIDSYFEIIYGNLNHQDVTDYFDADFLESHGNILIEELQELEPEQIPYGTMLVLLKHHFDVFGLIEKGLAISICDVE